MRIGFTYDTPTWFTITEETTQYLETSMIDEFDENSLLVTNPNAINVYEDYTIQMPSKITASGAFVFKDFGLISFCLLYTSPSPRDMRRSRMPSSA